MTQEAYPVGWKEVTDPQLLSQLNAPQQQTPSQQATYPPGWKEVTDPEILAQLNGTQPQSWGERYLNFIKQNASDDFGTLEQGVLGAGDALRNTIASGLNLIPGVNINPVQTGQGTAYGVGRLLGNVAGFAGGGDVLDTARAAAEGIPTVGSLAQYLGGQTLAPTIARNAIGGGIYGGLATNQDRTDNSIFGTIGGSLGASLPFGLGKLGQAAQYFMPQKYANQVLSGLSGGQNLQDATKSVLSAVKSAYEGQREEANELYNGVRNSVPNGSIYAQIKKPDPFMSIDPNAGYSGLFRPSSTHFISGGLDGYYPNLPSSITDNYTSNLKDLHDKFIENPTFANAHNLQSEIGSLTRQLSNGANAPTVSTINSINGLNTARTALKSDINSFLSKQGGDLLQKYQDASDSFQQNVVPYRTNPQIYSIASGDTTNVSPNSLANIFKSPDSDMEKVIGDLRPGTVDKILYTKLGRTTPANNPFSMITAYQRLNEQGLGDYISPDLSQQLGSLQNRIKARSLLQSAFGGLLGAAGGARHGSGGAVGMGLTGAAFASPVMNYLGRRLPLEQIGNIIGGAAKTIYPLSKTAILANYLNNSGGQS